jgi:hypothetical protein
MLKLASERLQVDDIPRLKKRFHEIAPSAFSVSDSIPLGPASQFQPLQDLQKLVGHAWHGFYSPKAP